MAGSKHRHSVLFSSYDLRLIYKALSPEQENKLFQLIQILGEAELKNLKIKIVPSAKIILEGPRSDVLIIADQIKGVGGRFDCFGTSMGPEGKDLYYVMDI